MATTVTSTRPETRKGSRGGGPRFPGPNGKGPHGNGWHGDGKPRRFSPAAYRIMMWVVLAAIVMMFAAMSSIYIALAGGDEWKPIAIPRMFFLSTAIIILSSITFEFARRCLKAEKEKACRRWLALTLLLGLAFLVTQLLAWRDLRAQGVYLSGNPHSSFFYLFTGVHGVHLLGGVLALLFLVFRMRVKKKADPLRTAASTSVVSRYWHTMDGLWLWLFLLLLIWR